MNATSLFFSSLVMDHPFVQACIEQAPSSLEEVNKYLYYSVLLALLPTFSPEDYSELARKLAERSEVHFKTWYNTLTAEQQLFIKETIERSLLKLKLI